MGSLANNDQVIFRNAIHQGSCTLNIDIVQEGVKTRLFLEKPLGQEGKRATTSIIGEKGQKITTSKEFIKALINELSEDVDPTARKIIFEFEKAEPSENRISNSSLREVFQNKDVVWAVKSVITDTKLRAEFNDFLVEIGAQERPVSRIKKTSGKKIEQGSAKKGSPEKDRN